jgi:succinate dehydrogenase/fumarate reductase cytochrome b subunit
LWYFEVYNSVSGVLTGALLVLPILSAGLIRQKGGEKYLAEAQQGPIKWLGHAMVLLSGLPFASNGVLKVQTSGAPTAGSALRRIILVFPHAIVLGLLVIFFVFIQTIASIATLISGSYPEWAAKFARGFLRWTARVLVYMASLVEEYPPFSFDTRDEAALPEAPA